MAYNYEDIDFIKFIAFYLNAFFYCLCSFYYLL